MRADVWKRFRKNKLAMFGLAFVVFLLLVAIFAPLITSYTYTETSQVVPRLTVERPLVRHRYDRSRRVQPGRLRSSRLAADRFPRDVRWR